MNHQPPPFRNVSFFTHYCCCDFPPPPPPPPKQKNAKMHVFSTLAGLSSLKLLGFNDKSRVVISSFQLIFCGSSKPITWSTVRPPWAVSQYLVCWSVVSDKKGGILGWKYPPQPGEGRNKQKAVQNVEKLSWKMTPLLFEGCFCCRWFSWRQQTFWSSKHKKNGPIVNMVKLSATKNTSMNLTGLGRWASIETQRSSVSKCSENMLIQVFSQSSPNKKTFKQVSLGVHQCVNKGTTQNIYLYIHTNHQN